ncbi:MAG: hypothetical protein P8X77_08205 [Maritimibacter sp.]
MLNFVLVSLGTGVLFGVMDGVINANPLAQRLNAVYAPIAKTGINMPAGIVIDLVYGFVIAGIFVLLHAALPGQSGLVKGLSLGLGIWFFRVVMSVATIWMTQQVPPALLQYQLATGLAEMLILGAFLGVMLRVS